MILLNLLHKVEVSIVYILYMSLRFHLLCFDSLGVKSSCVRIHTSDVIILLEPGISMMHSSFPATEKRKQKWYEEGLLKIKESIKKSDILISSHYHMDHFLHEDIDLYKNKTLLMKNPNEFINDNQRLRAEEFYHKMSKSFHFNDIYQDKQIIKYRNPLLDVPIAKSKDYGDYQPRKQELMNKGQRWFENRVNNWNNTKKIKKLKNKEISIIFPENQTFSYKNTKIRCSKPLFHGIEYARLGWIFSTIISHQGKKIMHTSDVCGPMIEDYAEIIIQENPDILILDGPATYLYGYMLTKINLNRTIQNAVEIIKNTDTKLIIYDHHLCRDKRFKQRTKPVWDAAKSVGVELLTAAEYLGKKPAVLEK